MVLQRPSTDFVLFSRAVLCSLLLTSSLLYCAEAGPQPAVGSKCEASGPPCGEGLVCVPETPGSVVHVCRETNRLCDTERCPRVWCGPNLQYTPEGECCPMCPPLPTLYTPSTITSSGCSEEGVHYQEGETWQRNSCTSCTCSAGLPLCNSIHCEIPEGCEHLVMNPGECCPTCAHVAVPLPVVVTPPQCVEENGEMYGDGENWKRNGDPCISCFCDNGEALCTAQHCYVECEHPVFLPDTCCPVCPDDDIVTNLPVPIVTSLPPPPPPPLVIISPPTHCEYGGQVYENGASWNPNGNPCTSCLCEEGFPLCFAQSCYAECETEYQVLLPGVCCPLCPGDEGYPRSSTTTSHPTPSTTSQTVPTSSSATTHTVTLSPTPPASDVTTAAPTTDTAPTIITTTSSPFSENTPAHTLCKDVSGVEWSDGESWCPTPHMKATCHSGTVFYSENHCPTLACQEPSWTAGSCNCPVCPDDTEETVVVSAILDMDYSQYLSEEDLIQTQLRLALDALGLKAVDIKASEYDHKQTQVVISVASLESDSKVALDNENLKALQDHLKSLPVSSLKVGHHNEPKSITDVSSKPQVQSSSGSHSGGLDKTTAIVAVTLTVAIALACLVVIIVIVTRVRKMRALPKANTAVV